MGWGRRSGRSGQGQVPGKPKPLSVACVLITCPAFLSPPQLAQKYDHQREQELREWIEGVTGRRIGSNFMDGLKDGIILCE